MQSQLTYRLYLVGNFLSSGSDNILIIQLSYFNAGLKNTILEIFPAGDMMVVCVLYFSKPQTVGPTWERHASDLR